MDTQEQRYDALAFVLDLQPERVNTDLVDLAPLTADDRDALHALIAKHRTETGSAVAERLVRAWPAAADRFTAVVPRDAPKVAELIATAEAAIRSDK